MRGYFIHLLSLQTSFAKDKTLQYLTKQLKSGCLPFTWTNTIWANNKQNFVRESRLPYLQISFSYRKTAAKA